MAGGAPGRWDRPSRSRGLRQLSAARHRGHPAGAGPVTTMPSELEPAPPRSNTPQRAAERARAYRQRQKAKRILGHRRWRGNAVIEARHKSARQQDPPHPRRQDPEKVAPIAEQS